MCVIYYNVIKSIFFYSKFDFLKIFIKVEKINKKRHVLILIVYTKRHCLKGKRRKKHVAHVIQPFIQKHLQKRVTQFITNCVQLLTNDSDFLIEEFSTWW